MNPETDISINGTPYQQRPARYSYALAPKGEARCLFDEIVVSDGILAF